MKPICPFIIFTLIIRFSVLSQSCLPEGITFQTQSEIDNFQTNYPGCSVIEGDVWIHGYDINNLNGLDGLSEIQGDLRIDSTYLTSLQGLNSLKMIGKGLHLYRNDQLYNVNGLDSLTEIAGMLDLSSTAVENFSGMTMISSIGGLELYWTDLTSCSGLERLTSINGNLNLIHCYLLDSLTGLKHVKSINGFLQISLSAVKSLSGLDSINPNSINNLTITDNPYLTQCDVESICSYLAAPNGDIHIDYNDAGCNTPEEVSELCFSNTDDAIGIVNSVNVYPNPTNNLLFFDTKQQSPIEEITIYDQTGNIIIREKGMIDKIDISEFPRGIYLMLYKSNSVAYKEKIFKN